MTLPADGAHAERPYGARGLAAGGVHGRPGVQRASLFYGDAIPSRWIEALRRLLDDDRTTYVPGHGSLASRDDLKPYMELMHTADAAKRAIENGVPASEAWRARDPQSLGEWGKFRPDVYRFAFEAWEKELRG